MCAPPSAPVTLCLNQIREILTNHCVPIRESSEREEREHKERVQLWNDTTRPNMLSDHTELHRRQDLLNTLLNHTRTEEGSRLRRMYVEEWRDALQRAFENAHRAGRGLSTPFSIELHKPRLAPRGAYFRVTNLSFDIHRLRVCALEALGDHALAYTNDGTVEDDHIPTSEGKEGGVSGLDGMDLGLDELMDVGEAAVVIPEHDQAMCSFMHFVREPLNRAGYQAAFDAISDEMWRPITGDIDCILLVDVRI